MNSSMIVGVVLVAIGVIGLIIINRKPDKKILKAIKDLRSDILIINKKSKAMKKLVNKINCCDVHQRERDAELLKCTLDELIEATGGVDAGWFPHLSGKE